MSFCLHICRRGVQQGFCNACAKAFYERKIQKKRVMTFVGARFWRVDAPIKYSFSRFWIFVVQDYFSYKSFCSFRPQKVEFIKTLLFLFEKVHT